MPVITSKSKKIHLKYPANWNKMTPDEKKKYIAKQRKAIKVPPKKKK